MPDGTTSERAGTVLGGPHSSGRSRQCPGPRVVQIVDDDFGVMGARAVFPQARKVGLLAELHLCPGHVTLWARDDYVELKVP